MCSVSVSIYLIHSSHRQSTIAWPTFNRADGRISVYGHQETFSRTFTRTVEYPLNSNSGLTLVIM